MKRIFVFILVLSTVQGAYAQSKKKAAVPLNKPSTVVTETVSKTEVALPRSPFEKFYDRLRIGYWSAFTSPTFDDMGKGQWKNAAISPEKGGGPKSSANPNGPFENQDTWPTNIWHQISFNYNFGAKMNFVFNPRFMTPLASPTDMKAPEDRSLIMLDDFLVGFQGTVISSADKKFNLFLRPAVRVPVSRASRNGNNGGFGKLSRQLELAYLPTYDFNKQWQLGVFGQLRMWVYNDRYNWGQFRFYTAPFVQYTINDRARLQVYYETMIENNKRWKSINGKNPVFKDTWQNLMIGPNVDITKKFNIFPFLGVFVNRPITDESFWIGAWISYQIK